MDKFQDTHDVRRVVEIRDTGITPVIALMFRDLRKSTSLGRDGRMSWGGRKSSKTAKLPALT
ncbi:MAG: hypothetical protein CTY31_06165 [Hyphomicrobium sp.]|nr:MAG: hypothetical protein CTY31_06165 [Hyphomicrobium sp.]